MNYLHDLKKIKRKILLKTIIICLILIVLFILPLCYDNDLSTASEYIKYFIIFCFLYIFMGHWLTINLICEKDIENYKKIYAKNITLEILKKNFENVIYNPNPIDDLQPESYVEIIENAKIPTTNSYENDDYISAEYKNIQFEYSDMRLGYVPASNDSNVPPSFKGKWLVLTFNKNFKSNIQIGPKIFNGKKNHQMLEGKKYEKIQIDDLEMNNKLIIYADNKDEVSDILTPTIINHIKQLYNETKGKIFIFFINNQIHIGIGDKKNFFEPNIYKKFVLDKEKNKIQKQVEIIINFINYWI